MLLELEAMNGLECGGHYLLIDDITQSLARVRVESVHFEEAGERAILRVVDLGPKRVGASPSPFSRDLELEITPRYEQLFRSFRFYPVVVNVRINRVGSDPGAARLGELFRDGPLDLPPKRDSGFEDSMRPGCITMSKFLVFLSEKGLITSARKDEDRKGK
jgi:hypothetical protein